uniref:Uncharacterized protein n=1 Tax=Kalanchoe fedtschenkoi TaxID=63787 RepID=A0A7N0UBB9_KALFE
MGVEWVLVCHGLVTLLVVISFLCGQWPIFQGTFVERIHYFLTGGFYDYLLRLVDSLCGSRGINAILSVEYFCYHRPNPILQLIYVAILGATYYFAVKSSFSYIPGYYLGGSHRYISLVAVCIGVVLFILTCFSDAGTVNTENVSQYLSAYPYDNILYSEKECSTCRITKPARSKHCSICNRIIASVKGTIDSSWPFFSAIGLILAGRLVDFKVIHILTVYYGIENSFLSLAPHVVQSLCFWQVFLVTMPTSV